MGAYLNGSTASTTDLHCGLFVSLRRIPDIWELPKARLTNAAITWKGLIHMHIHSIWRLFNTSYVSDIGVGAHLNGSTASTTDLRCDLSLSLRRIPDDWELPNARLTNAAIPWKGLIHMHIHSIWRLFNTLHVFDIDIGTHLNGSTSSTTDLHCSLHL